MTNSPSPQAVSLAPCPYCKGDRNLHLLDYKVWCGDCKAYGPAALMRSEAVAAWNRRASPADGLVVPDDVARLVIAARNVAFEDPTQSQLRALDIASEAFADRVPWDDEPEAASPALAATSVGEDDESALWRDHDRRHAVAPAGGGLVREAEWRDAITLILPLAKGYAAANRVGSNQSYVDYVESLLATPPSADADKLLSSNPVDDNGGGDTADKLQITPMDAKWLADWLAREKDSGHCGEGIFERRERASWNDRIDHILRVGETG